MRESDIRPTQLLTEYLRLSAEDALRLFDDADSRTERCCPACGVKPGTAAFEKNDFSFFHCDACRTLFANPAPEAGRLASFYRDSPSQRYWADVFFPAVAEARRQNIFRPRVERIRKLLGELGDGVEAVTDVGAGTGIFLEECRTAGLGTELAAIEPNQALAGALKDKGFRTAACFAADAAKLPEWPGTADLVTSFEVIEHVFSPADYLSDLAALARPGGLVLTTGLSGSGFDIRVLGKHSKAVSPPHHLNFLSRVGITHLLARTGLDEVAYLTPGELDVDIVCNALTENPELEIDGFLRDLVNAGDAIRREFQEFLKSAGLSSHMWILARRPA